MMQKKLRYLFLITCLAFVGTSISYGAPGNQNNVIELNVTENGDIWLHAEIDDFSGKMLVDTGATGSVLNDSLVENLKRYPTLEEYDGFGVGQESSSLKTRIIGINKFRVANQDLNIKRIGVHNIHHPDPQFIGVLGIDVLSELADELRFSQDAIQLLQNPKKDVTTSDSIETPVLKSKAGLRYFTTSLNQNSIGLIIDTGSEYTVLNINDVSRLGLKSQLLEGATSTDIQGNIVPVSLVEPVTLNFAGIQLQIEQPLALSLSSILENESFAHDVVGVIGVKDLRRFNAVYYLKKGNIKFVKSVF